MRNRKLLLAACVGLVMASSPFFMAEAQRGRQREITVISREESSGTR